jgi:hypothetical protein
MKKQNLLIGTLLGLFILSCSPENQNNQSNITSSIPGLWNLFEKNGDPNYSTCRIVLDITGSSVTEYECCEDGCEEVDSITTYTLNDDTFTKHTDNGDIVFTIITLAPLLLEWETIDPETNDIINLKYNRLE